MVTFVSQYFATEFARSDFISTCVTAVDRVGKGRGGHSDSKELSATNDPMHWLPSKREWCGSLVFVALPHAPGHISSLALFKLDLISRSHGRYRACLVCNSAYHHSPSRPALCSIGNHHEWAYVQSSPWYFISFHVSVDKKPFYLDYPLVN